MANPKAHYAEAFTVMPGLLPDHLLVQLLLGVDCDHDRRLSQQPVGRRAAGEAHRRSQAVLGDGDRPGWMRLPVPFHNADQRHPVGLG
jgi:hypothetical protein